MSHSLLYLVIVATCVAHAASRSAATLKWIDIEPKPEITSNLGEHPVNNDNRITNGFVAERLQFPYQVGLLLYMLEGAAWCGGSIITNRHVLTAAHCTDPITEGVDVYLGAWNRSDYTDKAMQVIWVPKDKNNYITVHEEWDMATLSNDISIIKVPIKIYFNEFIQKVNLPPLGSEPNYEEQIAIASGWGRTSDASPSVSTLLNFIEVSIMPLKTCKRYFLGLVQNYQVCIRTGSAHQSTCNGDSGGPLVLADGSRTLIGLTSFGITLGCERGFPGVFTSTYHFREWINNHTGIVDD